MAIVTYGGHTSRAKAFRDMVADRTEGGVTVEGKVYFGIGGQTPWTDENNPPPETEDETIADIICYKKITTVNYVKQNDAATEGYIEYRGHKYVILNESAGSLNIWTNHCKHIIIEANLNYDEAPTNVTYRKIGLYTGLEKTAAAASKICLLPGEVANTPVLEAIANDTPTTRSASKRESLLMLIEF